MNGLYRAFRRVLKHKDAAALSGVIRNNPSFHLAGGGVDYVCRLCLTMGRVCGDFKEGA